MFSEDDILKLIEEAKNTALEKFQNKSYYEAEIILEQLLKINPDNLEALQLYGLTKYSLGNYSESLKIFDRAINLEPNNAENYNNKGLCYSGLGNYDNAISALRYAIKLSPQSAFLYSNLGLQYRHNHEHKKAILCLKKALNLNENEIAWSMLGGCYGELQELDKAEQCFLNALKLNPNFPPAHVDLANVYFTQGKYEDGWKEYEWRFEVFHQLKVWKTLYNDSKRWKGESLENKTIIIHSEQGHGDCIHYFRYIPFIKAKKIILHCAKEMKALFENHVDEIYVDDPKNCSKIPHYDYCASILSLPHIMKMKEIPPLKFAISKKIDLSEYKNFYKIGIVWAGNPQHPNDSKRSCKLAFFKDIHDIPGVKLFSLVKDTRPRAYRFSQEPIDLTADADEMKIVNMEPMMDSFADTAAIIEALDIVISVDTSVLHLAGSLNKETYGLLPFNCDWRWGLSGHQTAWYPSMTLVRQTQPNDWKSVFDQIKTLIANKKSR